MTTYFFDTSALVKRYHEERGTDRVDAILDEEGTEVLISSLTVVESVSAFRRKYNRSEVSESEMNQLISVFFRERWTAYSCRRLSRSHGRSMESSSSPQTRDW